MYIGNKKALLTLLKGDKGEKGEKGDTGGAVDTTLTISGDAADAKSTGDSIRYNAQKIDMLANEHFYKATIDEVFTSRKTANGLAVVDGSPCGVLKISGSTVVEDNNLKHAYFEKIISTGKNLFDISKIPTHYYKHPSNNQYSYITNNGDGTLTMESVGYTIPMGVTLREVCPSLKVGDKVVGQAIVDGKPENFITFSGVWLYNHMSTEITEEMLNSEIKINTMWNGGDAVTITYSNIQIEIAEKSTEYEPCKTSEYGLPTPQELGKWDYIDPQTCELVKGTKTIVFDGTESWEQVTWSNGKYHFSKPYFTDDYHTTGAGEICNLHPIIRYLENVEAGETAGVYTAYVYNANTDSYYTSIVINMALSMQFTDVKAWKTHLKTLYEQGNPLTIAYELRTPKKTAVSIEKSYTVYNGGTETLIHTGETPKTEIVYYIKEANV